MDKTHGKVNGMWASANRCPSGVHPAKRTCTRKSPCRLDVIVVGSETTKPEAHSVDDPYIRCVRLESAPRGIAAPSGSSAPTNS